MAWTASNPVSIGEATKKSHYDNLWDNADYAKDLIHGDNAEGSGATGHDHDGTDSLNIGNLTYVTTRLHSSLQSIGTGDHHAQAHKDDHVDGTDDIRNATAAQKGIMTTVQAGVISDLRCDNGACYFTAADTYYDVTYAKFDYYVFMHVCIDESSISDIDWSSDRVKHLRLTANDSERALTLATITGAAEKTVTFKLIASGDAKLVQAKCSADSLHLGALAQGIDGINSHSP